MAVLVEVLLERYSWRAHKGVIEVRVVDHDGRPERRILDGCERSGRGMRSGERVRSRCGYSGLRRDCTERADWMRALSWTMRTLWSRVKTRAADAEASQRERECLSDAQVGLMI